MYGETNGWEKMRRMREQYDLPFSKEDITVINWVNGVDFCSPEWDYRSGAALSDIRRRLRAKDDLYWESAAGRRELYWEGAPPADSYKAPSAAWYKANPTVAIYPREQYNCKWWGVNLSREEFEWYAVAQNVNDSIMLHKCLAKIKNPDFNRSEEARHEGKLAIRAAANSGERAFEIIAREGDSLNAQRATETAWLRAEWANISIDPAATPEAILRAKLRAETTGRSVKIENHYKSKTREFVEYDSITRHKNTKFVRAHPSALKDLQELKNDFKTRLELEKKQEETFKNAPQDSRENKKNKPKSSKSKTDQDSDEKKDNEGKGGKGGGGASAAPSEKETLPTRAEEPDDVSPRTRKDFAEDSSVNYSNEILNNADDTSSISETSLLTSLLTLRYICF